MNPDIIRTLFDYHYSLFDRVWESVAEISEEQFNDEIAYSRGSIRHQLFHASFAESGWLRGIQGTPRDQIGPYNPDDYPTKAAVKSFYENGKATMRAYLANLDQAEIERVPEGLMGPVWQIMLHLVNHGTDHRAQVLRVLHDFGAPTFDQDMILHLWNI